MEGKGTEFMKQYFNGIAFVTFNTEVEKFFVLEKVKS